MKYCRLIIVLVLLLLVQTIGVERVRANEITDYQQELDIYRSLYSTYRIRLQEFHQFGTNTSEEDLIKAAREMLLARADTWIAYWKMLLIQTQPITSLQAATSANLMTLYTNEINWLTEHKQRLAVSARRDELMKESALLNLKGPSYIVQSTQGTALLYVGRLQGITKQLLQLNDALTQRTQSQQLGDEIKTVKLRGLGVNKDRLATVSGQLASMEAGYTSKDGASSESIDLLKIKLDPIYSQIKQLRQVLAELAEGVEW